MKTQFYLVLFNKVKIRSFSFKYPQSKISKVLIHWSNQKNTLFLILLFTFPLFPGKAQSLSQEISNELERRTRERINPSISIGILLPNEEEVYQHFGSTSLSTSKAANQQTLYEIGSVTKTFTATLAHRYLGDSMEAKLSNFIPKTQATPSGDIRISQLVNHISGLPRLSDLFSPEDWSDPFKGYSEQKLLDELKQFQPENESQWSYSNLGYATLGQALIRKSGKDSKALFEELFDAAGLEATFSGIDEVNLSKVASPTNLGISNQFWHFQGPSRFAGGIVSNTEDLLNYLKFQIRESPIFHQIPTEEIYPTGLLDLGEDKLFYSQGWLIFKPDEETAIIFHNGLTGGSTAFIGYNLNSGIGVILLSNSARLVDDIGFKLLYPDFQLQHPQRTIAYDLAESIEKGEISELLEIYHQKKKEGEPNNLMDIYWLERLHFGKENYLISNQLSQILVEELSDDWEVHFLKGQNLEKLEKYTDAQKSYEKSLELNPDQALVKKKLKDLANLVNTQKY